MTVCLTGDVHHMSMATRDQAHLDCTEVQAAIEYAQIAADHDVPVTLFCTGKCTLEERERMQRLATMDNVELGGHNYWAFTTPVHDVWRAVGKVTGGRIGSWMGPRLFQSWEIKRTLSAFADIGADVTAWRDHAYRHDDNTAALLANHGVTHFSDAVEPNGEPRRETGQGLIVVPINTPPDHEHVYHAFRTPEFVSSGDFEGPFGTESREPNEWLDWVRDCIETNRDAGRTATVLAHPACMQLADEFETFERLCATIDSDAAVAISDVKT